MDIIIGKSLDLRFSEQENKKKNYFEKHELNAQLISCRTSRKRPVVLDTGMHDRRAKRIFKDPSDSKVITLLIENGKLIPDDIEKGNYKISIKFIKG
jgi:hypothetical protein